MVDEGHFVFRKNKEVQTIMINSCRDPHRASVTCELSDISSSHAFANIDEIRLTFCRLPFKSHT